MKAAEQWMKLAKYITDNYNLLSNEETRIRRISANELAAILAAHAPQQWIPVSELPQHDNWVLVCRAGDAATMMAYWNQPTGEWVSTNLDLGALYGVTHWQPLPAPPVPDKQTEKFSGIINFGGRVQFDEDGGQYVVPLFKRGADVVEDERTHERRVDFIESGHFAVKLLGRDRRQAERRAAPSVPPGEDDERERRLRETARIREEPSDD